MKVFLMTLCLLGATTLAAPIPDESVHQLSLPLAPTASTLKPLPILENSVVNVSAASKIPSRKSKRHEGDDQGRHHGINGGEDAIEEPSEAYDENEVFDEPNEFY